MQRQTIKTDKDMGFNEDKKQYCGMYKGYKVYAVGCMIGNNWYGTYYAAKLCNTRYVKDKQSERSSMDDLKEYIDSRMK